MPIPVPLPMFSWSGNKASFLGDVPFYGRGYVLSSVHCNNGTGKLTNACVCRGIDFYTQNKTTTALWKAEDAIGNKASVDMPTHH